MVDNRVIRFATIAVWALAAAIIISLAFVRGAGPTTASLRASAGQLPVMYEFSTDT
jgi:hypothetical protein